MEVQVDTPKTLTLVKIKFKSNKIYNNYGLMKIRDNYESIKSPIL
jgi:hypothetical protein